MQGLTVKIHAPEPGDLIAVRRIVVTTDVQRSGSLDNEGHRRMRRTLNACVHSGAITLGLPRDVFETSDRGDGIVVVMPEAVTLVDVLDIFVEAVGRALRDHNQVAGAAHRIDLRAAVHVGHVDRVGSEWSGSPLVHAARLADAPAVKTGLSEADGCLALVVSDAVKQVVDEGYCRVGPAGYRRVAVVVKETSWDGWLRIL